MSGVLERASGLSGVLVAEGVGLGRSSDVEPAIHIFPALSTAPALAIDGEFGSSGIFHSSCPLISRARAKDLSTDVPKIIIVLALTTKPATSSLLLIVVTKLRALTAIFLGAACVDGVAMSVEIKTSVINRFTLIPASDRARLS